nr:hypothetical protein [uncultured Dysosmobacter sp.]
MAVKVNVPLVAEVADLPETAAEFVPTVQSLTVDTSDAVAETFTPSTASAETSTAAAVGTSSNTASISERIQGNSRFFVFMGTTSKIKFYSYTEVLNTIIHLR